MPEAAKVTPRGGGTKRMLTREFIYPVYDTFAELREKNRKNRQIRKRKVPNVKTRILSVHESDELLKDSSIDKSHVIVSEVYELLENDSKLSADELFIAPVNVIKKVANKYNFQFCWKADAAWIKEKAEYKGDGCVHGKPIDGDHVFVVADHLSETCVVDRDGLSFVPEQDKRIKVVFPRGLVEEEREFKVQIVGVELDRFREYRKRSPKLFDCVTGFSPTVRVDGILPVNCKKRVKIVVPIETCSGGDDDDDDDEVIFYRLNDDSRPAVVGPGRRLNGHSSYYSIDVENATTIICCRKASSAALEPRDVLNRGVKHGDDVISFLSGKRSFCNILIFIKFDPVGNDAVLLFDCVESTENRPQRLTERYADNGYEEILHTGLNDIPMDDNSRVEVDLEGGLKLLSELETSNMNFHLMFRRITPSNVLKIPIRPPIGKKSYTTITFRRPDCNWEYSVQFQADRNLLNGKNIITYTHDGVTEQIFVSNVKGTVKKNNVALAPTPR